MKFIFTFLLITICSFTATLIFVGSMALGQTNFSMTWIQFGIYWAVIQAVLATIWASTWAQKN